MFAKESSSLTFMTPLELLDHISFNSEIYQDHMFNIKALLAANCIAAQLYDHDYICKTLYHQ